MIISYLQLILFFTLCCFGDDSGVKNGINYPNGGHDLFMSVCEMERTEGGPLEVRFYLFHDDLKTALYGNAPKVFEIKTEDAQKYIAEKTTFVLNGQPVRPQFQSLEYHKDQVRLIYQIELSPDQKIEKIELTDRLLIEYFRTQVNMVYFIKNDGEKLVKMLDGGKVVAEFNL